MPTIGTCSNCQGPVQTPELWSGDLPPVPTCTQCGATARNPYGPVIQMEGGSRSTRPPFTLTNRHGSWKP
jgi:hypothetical protein